MIGRDSFLHVVVVAMMAVWVAAPAFVLAAVFFFFRRHSPGCVALFRWSGIIGIVFASCLPSLPAGYLVARQDVASAKSYCDALAPKIEAYHSRHGYYPRDIRLVAESSNGPRLLRDPTF